MGFSEERKSENSLMNPETVLNEPANPILTARMVPDFQKFSLPCILYSIAISAAEAIHAITFAIKVPNGNQGNRFHLPFHSDIRSLVNAPTGASSAAYIIVL